MPAVSSCRSPSNSSGSLHERVTKTCHSLVPTPDLRQNPQGLLEGPLLGVNEVRDRTVFRHGTDDFRPLFVSEPIVGVIARVRLRWSRLLNGRHNVTSQGQRP